MFEIVYHWWEVFTNSNKRTRQHYPLPTKYNTREEAEEVAKRYRLSHTFIYKAGDRISVRKARA